MYKPSRTLLFKAFFSLGLCLVTLPVNAGGAAFSVKVIRIQEGAGNLTLFMHKQKHKKNEPCSRFQVKLKYERVPWYSWVPFVDSYHPSPSENQAAIQKMKGYHKNQTVFEFGEVSGLKQTKSACVFMSKGLKVTKDKFIVSFYYPI